LIWRVERRDHGVEYWSRPKPAPAPTSQARQPSVAEIEQMRAADRTRFVDGRISAAIAARDEYWRDVLGGLVSAIRKQLRAEISAEVGQLRADIAIEKAAERREHGEIIDMLVPLERKRRA
jgi:hypothetical protein